MGMGTGIEPLKGLGILWGRGRLKLWGFFGGKSPKNSKNGAGMGEGFSGILSSLLPAKQNFKSFWPKKPTWNALFSKHVSKGDGQKLA